MRAVDGVTLDGRAGRARGAVRPERVGEEHAADDVRGAARRPIGEHPLRRARGRRLLGARERRLSPRRRRLRLAGVSPDTARLGAGERDDRAGRARASRRARRARRRCRGWSAWVSARAPRTRPSSCRWGSASGWRSPGRWSASRGLLLTDEPTGNLDSERSKEVLELLGEICREREAPGVLVTHDPDAVELVDRVLTLRDGRLVDEPPPDR